MIYPSTAALIQLNFSKPLQSFLPLHLAPKASHRIRLGSHRPMPRNARTARNDKGAVNERKPS